MDVRASISDNSDGWDEEFNMGDPLFHDSTDTSKEAESAKRLETVEIGAGQDEVMPSPVDSKYDNGHQQVVVPDTLDLRTNQSNKSTEEYMRREDLSTLHRSMNQNPAKEISSSSHQISVGTETGGLIPMITRSSSTDESYFGPSDNHQAAMITSISTVSDGSEEDRFVKVKPGDFEFESSKGSSQSGKDNLDADEQISLLNTRCEKLQAQLAEKEDNYLAVKLQLESILEKNTESNSQTKAAQEIGQIKDELLVKTEKLMNLMTEPLAESSDKADRIGFRLELDEEGSKTELDAKVLSQEIGFLVRALLATGCTELKLKSELSELSQGKRDHYDIEGSDDGLRSVPSEASFSKHQINPAGVDCKPEAHQQPFQALKDILEEKSSQITILNGRCAELETSLSFTQQELSELRNGPNVTPQRSNPIALTPSSVDSFSNVELNLDDDITPEAEKSDNIDTFHFATVADAVDYLKPLIIRNQSLEQQINSMQMELEELKERENDVIGGYQSVSASLVKVQIDYDELQKELLEKQSEIAHLHESIKTKTDQEITRFKEELISKDEDLMELEANLVELKTSSQQKEVELSNKISNLEAALRELSEKPLNPEMSTGANNLEELNSAKEQLAALKDKYDKLEDKFKKAVLTIKQRNVQLAEAKECESRSSPQLSTADPSGPSQILEMQSIIVSLEAQLKEKDITIKHQEELLAESEVIFKRMKSSLEKEIFEKNEYLINTREQLNQTVSNMDEKTADIEQLMKHTEELQALISRQNEDLSSAITEKDEEIRRTIQQYEEFYQQSQEKINQLTYNLHVKLDEISSTKEEFTELEKDLASAQHEVGELKRLLQSSEQGQQQASASLRECQSALDEKRLELQHSYDERNALQIKVGELTLDIKKKTAIMNQLDETLSVKSETVNLLEFSVNECKATIADNNQQISELQNKLRSVIKELEESQTREEESRAYKESYKELVQLKKENNQLQLQVADTENRFQHMVQEFERKSTEMEMLKDSEVLGSRNDLNQMKEERDSLLKDLQQSHDIISMLENEKGNLATSIQVAQTTIAETTSKLQSVVDELKARDNSIKRKEIEVNQLRTTIASLQSAYEESQSKVAEMTNVIGQLQTLQTSKEISGPAGSTSSLDSAPPSFPEEIKKLLDEETSRRETLERKVELLQGKIYEIEVSEMKSFEECLLLKSWMRDVELENIKYTEELRGYQSTSAGENPKVKTLQNEILRMVQALEDRDKRSVHLTMEITRLLEERDSLQLKLSSTLRENMVLNEKSTAIQTSSVIEQYHEQEQLKKKLAQLEETNYLLDIDLRRAKEARRLVQEQLLLSQTSRFYREGSQSGQRQVPLFSMPPTTARNAQSPPAKPEYPVPEERIASQLHDTV